MDDIRVVLQEFSDAHLDASMFPLIRKWDSPETSLQVLEVLDHCINGSLASGFIITVFQALYSAALKREGKTHEDNVPFATWRQRS